VTGTADRIHAVTPRRAGAIDYQRIAPGLIAEIVFAMLPLLVIFLVLLQFHKAPDLWSSPEWSFAAAILFGQSIVRFMSGFAHGGHARPGPVSLAIALIIVLGLTPSLLVLSGILTAEIGGKGEAPAPWLVGGQVVLFVSSVLTYLIFGAISEAWRQQEE